MAEWTLDGEPPFSVEDAWIEGWDFTQSSSMTRSWEAWTRS